MKKVFTPILLSLIVMTIVAQNSPLRWNLSSLAGSGAADQDAPAASKKQAGHQGRKQGSNVVISPVEAQAPPTAVDLSTYVRVGRYNLPEPTRTPPPVGSLLAQEASGVTYNWDTQTLFVVGDGGTSVVQVDKTGQLVNSMTLAAGSSPQGTEFYDPEGITYIGNGQFVFTEERDRQLVLFTYVAGATLTRANAKTVKLGTTIGNIGFEGLSYDPLTSGFIIVKETSPLGIFQTGVDFNAGTATNGSPTADSSINLFNPALAGLLDFADVFALSNIPSLSGQPDQNRILILSQESGKVVLVDRSGTVYSSLTIQTDAGNPLSIPDQQHEGMTMDGDGNLYIVNENGGGDFDHPQLWVYAPSTAANQAPTAVSLNNKVDSLLENTSTASPYKVADIVVTDDGLGTNNFYVSGADSAFFQITGSSLFIKAGTVLDYETKTTYNVTVNVDDSTVGVKPDASVNYTLNLINQVVETPNSASIIISEVAPWSSGNSPIVLADWFEVSNTSTAALNITGWKMDDNSNSFASSVPMSGITSIGAGESVIFIEISATLTADSAIARFKRNWFGANVPAGLQIGTYIGSGVGLSTAGDAVNLYNAAGVLQANVSFGASPAGPYPTFNNAAGANNASISTLSIVGVNGAFKAVNDVNEIGSPGTIGKLFISEVAPWSSGNSPIVAADWFEVTNTKATAVDITGWKMDDNSGSFVAGVPISGVTSIGAGKSVIFIETSATLTLDSAAARFKRNWFGANPPTGLQIAGYQGAGVGLGTGGDAVNLYNTTGILQASVTFGTSPIGTFPTFDNAAGLNNATISQLSVVGVNGAFKALSDSLQIGSPGQNVTISVTVTAPPITCVGGTTPVTVTATGGAAPYTVSGDSLNVPAGVHTYKVTDAQGNTGTGTITIAPGSSAAPTQPSAFTTKTTFVYKGDNAVAYTVPSTPGVTYAWSYSGTGATINGTGNSVTLNYAAGATSGTLSVTANSTCGASTPRTLPIVTNDPIVIPTTNYDYSFVTVGCNRLDYLDTAFTAAEPDYFAGPSTANVYQLKRLFTEISHMNPLPKYLFMTGDIVMGYINDTVALARQLTEWRKIYESHPLSQMATQLVVVPGNHETQDKAAGKKSFVAAERTFVRIMAPYIRGNNGPGVGGADNLATDQSQLSYSFNFGGDHFIVLNTDPVGADGTVSYKWLANDIQTARANNARHIFAFGHKPAYSSPLTPAGGLDAAATLAQRDSLWKYLEDYNAEAMFSAHEHLFDTINPHKGSTWQVIAGNGGSRVEPVWKGAGKQYYGYTLVNMYTDRKVNVMGLGRNTDMTDVVGSPFTINEDANPTTVRTNFNICLTTKSTTTVTANNSYTWNGTTYTSSGTYTKTLVNAGGCDSIAKLILTLNTNNQIPKVAITSPTSPASFNAGASITVNVSASDSLGRVSKVELFVDGSLFATDSIAPYAFSGSNVEAGVYKVVAKATDDSSATALSDTLTITVNGCNGSGSITGEGYTNISGSQVADLTSNPAFPNSPAITAALTTFEYRNVTDNYGGRVRGYICAPVTGDYRFHIAADDQAGLWLSTDENPANKVLVAYTETATGFREWNKFGSQTSAPIRLVKGVRYYIETLHKEAVGQDHLSVGWTLPGGNFEAPIPGSRLSPIGSVFPNALNVVGSGAFAEAMANATNGNQALKVKVLPNPSSSYFTINLTSGDPLPVQMKVVDIMGRVMENRSNLPANGSLQVGDKLPAGIYFVELTQGSRKERLKLIKL